MYRFHDIVLHCHKIRDMQETLFFLMDKIDAEVAGIYWLLVPSAKEHKYYISHKATQKCFTLDPHCKVNTHLFRTPHFQFVFQSFCYK